MQCRASYCHGRRKKRRTVRVQNSPPLGPAAVQAGNEHFRCLPLSAVDDASLASSSSSPAAAGSELQHVLEGRSVTSAENVRYPCVHFLEVLSSETGILILHRRSAPLLTANFSDKPYVRCFSESLQMSGAIFGTTILTS